MRPNAVPMSRDMPGLVVNYFRARVLWNENIGGGKVIGLLPPGAFLLPAWAKIITTFNGTTPIITCGTDGSQANILGAGEITEGTAGVYGPSMPASHSNFGTPTPLFVRGVFAGAITEGECVIVVPFDCCYRRPVRSVEQQERELMAEPKTAAAPAEPIVPKMITWTGEDVPALHQSGRRGRHGREVPSVRPDRS